MGFHLLRHASRFKRDPAVYQNAIRLLGMEPQEIMMAAAHNDDLEAARKEGMRTAYINRPYDGADQRLTLRPQRLGHYCRYS